MAETILGLDPVVAVHGQLAIAVSDPTEPNILKRTVKMTVDQLRSYVITGTPPNLSGAEWHIQPTYTAEGDTVTFTNNPVAIWDGETVNYPTGPAITGVPPTAPDTSRYDGITANEAGQYIRTEGQASQNPEFPQVDLNNLFVGYIQVFEGGINAYEIPEAGTVEIPDVNGLQQKLAEIDAALAGLVTKTNQHDGEISNAVSAANSAATTASQAAAGLESALSAAQAADTKAEEALGAAENAESLATSANSAAQSAQTTASGFGGQISTAVSTANQARQIAESSGMTVLNHTSQIGAIQTDLSTVKGDLADLQNAVLAAGDISWIVRPLIRLEGGTVYIDNVEPDLPKAEWNGNIKVYDDGGEDGILFTGLTGPEDSTKKLVYAVIATPQGEFVLETGPESDQYVHPPLLNNRLVAAYIQWGAGAGAVVPPTDGGSVPIDTFLSESSTNPVQNLVITGAIIDHEERIKTLETIPDTLYFNTIVDSGEVIIAADPNSWDQRLRELGNLLVVGDTYIYSYTGHPVGDLSTTKIGIATSPDGKVWTKQGKLNEDLSEDPYLVFHEGTYYMYVEKKSGLPQTQGNTQLDIRLYTSTDLQNWTDRGIVLEKGPAGSWDASDVSSPTVFIKEGLWYMYFEGRNADTGQLGAIGYATSANGISWTKQGAPNITGINLGEETATLKWADSCVPDDIKQVGTLYIMTIHALSLSGVYLGGAVVSTDLINWSDYLGSWLSKSDNDEYMGAGVQFFYERGRWDAIYLRTGGSAVIRGLLTFKSDYNIGSKPLVISPAIGVTLDLGSVAGRPYNFGATDNKSRTAYTPINPTPLGYAIVLVNASSEPTVAGATKIAGSAFAANVNMHMVVHSMDGINVQYYFLAL